MKTFIFDLDGTVVNTLYDITYNINLMLQYYCFEQHTAEEVKRMIGNGAKNLVKKALPDNHYSEDFIEEALNVYQKFYDKNTVVNTFVYDGMKEALLNLKQKGHSLAIISNKDERHVSKVIDKLLPDVFDIVKGFDATFLHKPSPEIVFSVMEILNSEPECTYFVGDSVVDVLTAKNAGIKSVGVTWGFGGENSFEELAPSILISKPSQLLTL